MPAACEELGGAEEDFNVLHYDGSDSHVTPSRQHYLNVSSTHHHLYQTP